MRATIRPTGNFLPNRIAFLFLHTLEGTIGLDGQKILLGRVHPDIENPAPPPDDLEKAVDFASFSGWCAALHNLYGRDSARRMLFRTSRASFQKILPEWAGLADLEDPLFLPRPVNTRIAKGWAAVASILQALSDMHCESDANAEDPLFRIFVCPECAGRSDADPLCSSMAGMLRGVMDWLGIDKTVGVEEHLCCAAGAPYCEFRICAVS